MHLPVTVPDPHSVRDEKLLLKVGFSYSREAMVKNNDEFFPFVAQSG